MKKAIDKPRIRLYLAIGLIYASLWLLSKPEGFDGTFLQLFGNSFWRIPYIIIVNFIFFEYTIPFVLRKRRFIIYNILLGVFLLWIHVLLWAYGLYAWRGLGVALNIYTGYISPQYRDKPLHEQQNIVVTMQMAYSMGSVIFFGVIRHFYNYIKLKQATQQLRIEKQEAELNYLKSQTNPHFLFNTLNNIYSLTRDKSDLAPESILRLSKILRFMLYETGGAYISIEQELKIITDYVALEKLRYDESLRVNFNHSVEDMKQAIPPLLLMPLVENAFKHGVSETRGRPFVDIHLAVNKRQLEFVVKNSSETLPGEKNVKENIGLSNLRRQLELLYKEYNLSVEQGQGVFTAVLKINLSSHV